VCGAAELSDVAVVVWDDEEFAPGGCAAEFVPE
jgi:hypothetical protein